MKFEKARYALLFIAFGLFLLLDRFLKGQSLSGWSEPRLLGDYFGWMPFLNPGVAFSIPIPNFLIILVSIPIVVVVLYLLGKELFHTTETFGARFINVAALGSILVGAISNLIDRLWLKHTIDYLLVGTGVINLADVFIVIGFVLYFYSLKHKKSI